jgi:plasmid stability protein
MNTITIKGLSADIHRRMKSRARAHGRSLNKEIIATLEASLGAARADADATATQARAVRETMGVYLTQRDLDAFKKAGRR